MVKVLSISIQLMVPFGAEFYTENIFAWKFWTQDCIFSAFRWCYSETDVLCLFPYRVSIFLKCNKNFILFFLKFIFILHTNSVLSSSPSCTPLTFLSLHPQSTPQRGSALPWGVNKICHIILRQVQDPSPCI